MSQVKTKDELKDMGRELMMLQVIQFDDQVQLFNLIIHKKGGKRAELRWVKAV